jgi:hypothetical protein
MRLYMGKGEKGYWSPMPTRMKAMMMQRMTGWRSIPVTLLRVEGGWEGADIAKATSAGTGNLQAADGHQST